MIQEQNAVAEFTDEESLPESNDRLRERLAAIALRELDVMIDVREAELAAMRRARSALDQKIVT